MFFMAMCQIVALGNKTFTHARCRGAGEACGGERERRRVTVRKLWRTINLKGKRTHTQHTQTHTA